MVYIFQRKFSNGLLNRLTEEWDVPHYPFSIYSHNICNLLMDHPLWMAFENDLPILNCDQQKGPPSYYLEELLKRWNL